MRSRMFVELKEKCCNNCERCKRCERTNVYTGFSRLIDAGCIKGKVNLIDLPSEMTVNCARPADVLNELNLLLTEYRRCMTEKRKRKVGTKDACRTGARRFGSYEELCRRFEPYAVIYRRRRRYKARALPRTEYPAPKCMWTARELTKFAQ